MLWAICNTLAKRPSGLELIKAGTPHRKGYTSKTEEVAVFQGGKGIEEDGGCLIQKRWVDLCRGRVKVLGASTIRS